jgi:polysaccharide export outer membrane protein
MSPHRGTTAGALALALLAMPGCARLSRHQEAKIPQYGVIDPSQPRELRKVTLPRHVIEPADQLEVLVRPPLRDFDRQLVQVLPDGTIDLGLYGHYYVAGLCLEEAEIKLTQGLASVPERSAATDPLQAAIRLADGQQVTKKFYVLGTVNTPSSYPIRGNETVLDAILLAGLKSNSLPDKSYLVRPHPQGGDDQVLAIDWPGITQRGETTTNYQLMPGDRVYVPGGKPPGLIQTLIGR